MAENKIVPELRFAGFTAPWEQRKLGEITEIQSAARVHKEEWRTEGVPFFRSSDVMAAFNGTENDKAFISQELFEKLSSVSGKPQEGDIFVTGGGSVGTPYLVPNNDPLYSKDADLIWIRRNSFLDSLYTYFFFVSPGFREYLSSISHVGTIAHYTIEQVKATSIPTPSIDEQKLIGAFFSDLDNLITLHQRKYDRLMNIKKALLEKMFPKAGYNVPELRFAGFTAPWEQCKLKDLCSIFTDGDWIEAKDQSENGIRLIQTGNIGVTEYYDKPDNKKWISQETFERLHCTEVLSGDILISRLPEPAGRACIMPNIGQKMITAVDCTIARVAPDYSPKYIVQYLATQNYFNEVNQCLAGGTRQRISRGNLSDFLVPIPRSKAEQEQIGALLQSIDNLITLHQRKYEKLKHLKQSLLEKMFV